LTFVASIRLFLINVVIWVVLILASSSVSFGQVSANTLKDTSSGSRSDGSLDIDGNNEFDALTDGLLLLRSMFGLSGTPLITGAVAGNALYTTSDDIEARISALGNRLDIDNNGQIDALTDGLLILRYLFGLDGDALIGGVIAPNALRTTASEVEEQLLQLVTLGPVGPIFASEASFNAPENQTNIGVIYAIDGNGDPVTYTISGSELSITPGGVLSFASAPDYEIKTTYSAVVTATDGEFSATQSIIVRVSNVNDVAPVFDSNATFSVDENQKSIGTVVASDIEDDSIIFSVSGSDVEITTGGVLSFVDNPDYEIKSKYIATVSASDSVNIATQNITINIININDNSPLFISGDSFNIDENQTAIGTVEVSDADGDTLTLSVSGSELAVTAQGALSFVSAPDYESKSTYTATITVSDGSNSVSQDITITVNDLVEIEAETNININENTQVVGYSINAPTIELIRDYGRDFTPTHAIGNADGTNYVLNDDIVINSGQIFQALSDIQIASSGSITIKAGGSLISRYVEIDGSYSRPAFTTGTEYSNSYGQGIVLVSNDGSNYEEENSVGNQNILLFDGASFIVEGTSSSNAEMRNISIAYATDESSDNAVIDINYLHWRGGSLHPYFFRRTNAQSTRIYGSLTLKNSYLSFINSVNLMRLTRTSQTGDIIIEDNVFHNSGGFSLDFNYQTSGLLRIQRNLYFGEDVYRSNKPAFLSVGTTGGTAKQYPKHTDGYTKVLFKDNAILATPETSKAIYCESSDPYVPWQSNYFGYRSDFDNTVRKVITDSSSDLSKTCSYPNSLILLDAPRTWEIKPIVYFTSDNQFILDVPIDYESATNKVMPFNVKATNSSDESLVLDMQMTIIDVDEPAEPIISEILDQISVQENTVFVSNFSIQSDSTDTVTMSLSGDDADKFEISSNNLLSFKTAPNYEVPTDTDSDNVYKVTLVANTGSTSASMNIDVSVTNAIEELNAPTFSNFTASTTSVDVSSSSQDITFSLRVQDESGASYQSGYGGVAMYADGFSASGIANSDANAWTLKSGNDKDGIWEVTLTVPQGQLSGNYSFNSGAFRDVNGAYASCGSNYTDTTANGSCGTYQLIAVDNGAESNAPTFSNFTASTTSVDVSSSSQDITFSLRVQDESGASYQSGYGGVAMYADGFSASGIANSDANAWTLKSGNDKDGIWEVTLTVPQGQLSGNYSFSSGAFRDVNGAYATCGTYFTDTTANGSCGAYQLIAVTNDASSSTIYYLYGGTDQSDYLGCYGCANTATDSVCNSVGTYGSNLSTLSIWNTVGSYGSTVGTYSPWNSVSSNPPEFFNQDKSSSYGKFTVNTATASRTTVSSLTNIIDYFNNNSQDIGATRTNACSGETAFTQASQRSLLKTNRTSINVSKDVSTAQ